MCSEVVGAALNGQDGASSQQSSEHANELTPSRGQEGSIPAVQLLLEEQVNVNSHTSKGITPLHIACKVGLSACVHAVERCTLGLCLLARGLFGLTGGKDLDLTA